MRSCPAKAVGTLGSVVPSRRKSGDHPYRCPPSSRASTRETRCRYAWRAGKRSRSALSARHCGGWLALAPSVPMHRWLMCARRQPRASACPAILAHRSTSGGDCVGEPLGPGVQPYALEPGGSRPLLSSESSGGSSTIGRYDPPQCGVCVMLATTGATGVRGWLQTHLPYWMTPKRLRAFTVALFTVAILASSVTISGSTPNDGPQTAHPAHAGQFR